LALAPKAKRGAMPVSAEINAAASSSAGCKLAAAAINGRGAASEVAGAKATEAKTSHERRCMV
jgi:hypothetical protein